MHSILGVDPEKMLPGSNPKVSEKFGRGGDPGVLSQKNFCEQIFQIDLKQKVANF